MSLIQKSSFFVLGVFLFLVTGLQLKLPGGVGHSSQRLASSPSSHLTSDRLALPPASAPTPDSGIPGCSQEAPLLHVDLPSSDLSLSPLTLGEWRLALSANHPDIMTEARAQLKLVQNTDVKRHWSATVTFSFPDPKPFGIPFTFQKARLSWQSAVDAQTRILVDEDWSEDCTSVGRSIFPGQKWSATFELPGFEEFEQVKSWSFEVWGSRN